MLIDRFNGYIYRFSEMNDPLQQRKNILYYRWVSGTQNKKLKAWLEENKNRIEVFFIPPYSPELNAQEYLNQDVKTNVIDKKRPINKAEMCTNVEDFVQKKK